MTQTVATRPPAIFHSPADIEAALGERIVGAKPLGCEWCKVVLLMETSSGKRYIYKSLNAASLEPEFYELVESDLLPGHSVLLAEPHRTALLIDYIDAPSVTACRPSSEQAVAWAFELPKRIQEMADTCPFLEIMDTREAWRGLAERSLAGLTELAKRGSITFAGRAVLDELERALANLDGKEVLAGDMGLIHSDLHTDNVFLLPDGRFKVIDWERPRLAPLAVDTALLLESLDIDPWLHVHPDAVRMMSLLRLADCVQDLLDLEIPPDGSWERYILFRVGTILGEEGRQAGVPASPSC
jgi:hypothetical protein